MSAPKREVTLEEAIGIAVLFQKHGQLAEAHDVFQQVLAAAPDHADALHFAGILAQQQGRHEDAVALIERSLAIEPGRADCYSNLGIIYRSMGRAEEAIAAYRQAIALSPAHANAYSNLGVLLKSQGQVVEAEEAYRAAIVINPEHCDAHHNLGVLLAATARIPEAVQCFCRVTTLSPRHPETRKLLALAHCNLGEYDKAVKVVEDWLVDEPESPVAQHLLAACSGKGVPVRASDAYVEETFDGFARSFDEKLAKLAYRAPALVGAMLADTGEAAKGSLDILDAGCGTGLCGPIVAPYARRLVGVDLSAAMLAQAEPRGVYDQLVKSELTTFLRDHRDNYDVIVSADTLCYFGALEEVFGASAGALRAGGRFVFTLEQESASLMPSPGGASEDAASASADEPSDWRLEHHGRYVHSRSYVERAMAAAGFNAVIAEAELRMESGVPVAGLVVCATKPAADAMSEGGAHG